MFAPRVALASLSGVADAHWAASAQEYAGAAFLGGIAIDEAAREGARQLVDRGREEFLPDDPIAWIEDQLTAFDSLSIRAGINVRSATRAPIADAARICAHHDGILEINAHCRQPELRAVGCGEMLLRDPERLRSYVQTAREEAVTVSVKVRAEVDDVDLPALCETLDKAGADYLHVDAMDTEAIVQQIATATDCFVIANNEVRDRQSVHEYLEYGADAVSVGRPSDNPRVLERVCESTSEWFDRQQLTA